MKNAFFLGVWTACLAYMFLVSISYSAVVENVECFTLQKLFFKVLVS